MNILELINSFYDAIDLFDSEESLVEALRALCEHIGFRYFAVVHHVDFGKSPQGAIRHHNYPKDFASYFDANELGVRDPVHRASQLRGAGFLWSTLPRLLTLSKEDRAVGERAQEAGIGDGLTVPFNVPGEYTGSCSFAMSLGTPFQPEHIPLAQALGIFAFEAARRLHRRGNEAHILPVRLTNREREIVLWLGHGKQEKEIARKLDISVATVNGHLRNARANCGVHKSHLLIVCGLLAGSITYNELLAA